MKRRSFIKSGSLLAAPSLLGGIPVSAFKKNKLSTLVNGDSDRVLVLIQLNGGNDGLNTVLPLDQESGLAFVRPQIYIPNSMAVKLTDEVGVHPAFAPMKDLYDSSKLNIIQGVAYPDQNRSHFRSMDIWNTGSSADQYLSTGWVGRFLDTQFPNFPQDYPNSECTDPFALTIGTVVSETCQGVTGNFSLTITDPQSLNQLNTPVNNESINSCGASNLDFIFKSIEQTNQYSSIIEEKFENGNSLSDKYNLNDDLSNKLKTVAQLISGGLKTKIYVVSLGGFDTHAYQAEESDTTTGQHAELLSSLSTAICAFQDDLTRLGVSDKVLGMTYSEFGRRILGNFSAGTDHGTAGPLFVFGDCVNPGILGENAQIERDVSQSEGVPMQFDFRSVYGSVLMDWFELEEATVKNLFAHDFQYIPIANTCNSSTSISEIYKNDFKLQVYPSPFTENCTIEFESKSEWIKVSLFDVLGSELRVLTNQKLNAGKHSLRLEGFDFPTGIYFVRIQNTTSQKTVRIVKQS